MVAQSVEKYEAMGDLQLAGCVAANDPAALRLVMQRNNQRLFRAAWSILRNRPDAEDAVQEAYVRAFAGIAGYKGASSLSTWLTRIVINESLGRKRASKRRSLALDTGSVVVMTEYREKLMGSSELRHTPEAALMRKQLAKLLEAAIARLPQAFRMVFVLREIEHLSVEETAEALGIRQETVKTRLFRARHRLQQMLDPELREALGETFPFAGVDCDALTARVLQRLGHSARAPAK
jgi:RNA polymerase sigma-70 factor (ECF subfamily)